MNKEIAPIILFCYNRVEYLIRTVMALRANELAEQSQLIIFSDGAKNEKDLEKVKAVREYIRLIQGFKYIEIHENSINQGLANSVITGVTKVINRYGKAIVLEDDLVTSPYFLRFMNEALERYEQTDKVISILGHTIALVETGKEVYFQRGAHCWGWATWKRGWDLFESDTDLLISKLDKHMQKSFDYDHVFSFYQMLLDQKAGKIDSWAIRWYASAFLNQKLTLVAGRNLIDHIGTEQGTHISNILHVPEPLAVTPIRIPELSPRHDDEVYRIIVESVKNRICRWKRYFNQIKHIIKLCCPWGMILFYEKKKAIKHK